MNKIHCRRQRTSGAPVNSGAHEALCVMLFISLFFGLVWLFGVGFAKISKTFVSTGREWVDIVVAVIIILLQGCCDSAVWDQPFSSSVVCFEGKRNVCRSVILDFTDTCPKSQTITVQVVESKLRDVHTLRRRANRTHPLSCNGQFISLYMTFLLSLSLPSLNRCSEIRSRLILHVSTRILDYKPGQACDIA